MIINILPTFLNPRHFTLDPQHFTLDPRHNTLDPRLSTKTYTLFGAIKIIVLPALISKKAARNIL